MNKIKDIKMINYSLLAIILICLIVVYRYKIKIKINESVLNQTSIDISLTTQQKLDDFNEFYENIIDSNPLIQEQEKLYGTNFKDNKEKYIQLIKNSTTDFEFFAIMNAIEEDIPSFHTDICFPMYSNIKSLNCYNLDQTLARGDLKGLSDFWYNIIGEGCKEFADINRANFKYIEGAYIFDSNYSSQKYQEYSGYELIAINNELMEKYIIDNISTYKMYYDYKRNIPYRWYFTLNDGIGEKVKVTLENADGDTIDTELYIDIQLEIVESYEYLYTGNNNEDIKAYDTNKDIYTHLDDENNIGYIAIRNFSNNEGEYLKSKLKEFEIVDNLIIDLRGNTGGYRGYGIDYLFPGVSDKNITQFLEWYVPYSKSNEVINNRLVNKLFYQESKSNEGVYYNKEYQYQANSTETPYNVYYLIDRGTASAADSYISAIKENDISTIIGTNTAGEGLADSFVCDALKHSGLVYIYSPSVAYNTDVTNNSLYGTKPDLYIEQTKESFYKQRYLEIQGYDVNTYEEKLKYDTQLIETIKMISQKE